MDLFSQAGPLLRSLLPRDGIATYFGSALSGTETDSALDALLDGIARRNEDNHVEGKKIVTARKIAWYGDKPDTAMANVRP